MKSRRKKRLLAMVLCVVMILSLSISVMAEGGATASDGTESEAMLLSDGAESSETITEPTPEPTAEPTPEVTQTPEATPEVTPEPVTTTPTPTPETVQEDSETVQTDVTTDESQTSDVQNVETQSVTPDSEPVQAVQPYESSYEDNDVVIRVSAEAGIVPEGAVLSVTPIVKRDVTDDMTDEEKAQVEAVNAQYDLTEKKLTEDSEAKEETMEGFLAYDISFLVDGVEVEPSGDVNVTMEFKQAALPEGVSEDASISVKHLKEEAAAVDGVVVEDMAEKASVQTTNAAAVEKVELTANSFSTFTISWQTDRWLRSITVHHVDTNGNEIQGTQTQTVNLKSGHSVVFENYAGAEGYDYLGAHLNNAQGTEIYSVKYDSKGWSYKLEENGRDYYEWPSQSRNVYLVYERNTEIQVHFVSGADGSNLREPMSLSDFFSTYGSQGETTDVLAPDIDGYRFVKTMLGDSYNQYEDTSNDRNNWPLRMRKFGNTYQYNLAKRDSANDNSWKTITKDVYFIYKVEQYQIDTVNSSAAGINLNIFNYDKSINNEAASAGFPFHNNQTNHIDGTNNNNTGGNVKNTLSDYGYPVSENGTELDFLFGENEMAANYLFTYNPETYSYEYDSQTNHALYDEDDGRFYVYDYTISPGNDISNPNRDFAVGNFFPFNDVSNPKQDSLNYIQYGLTPRSQTDYWFGMSMNLNFYQPEDGILPNGDDMRFEFRGDDDVFVYLDGVLILDLGGIHAAQSGTIDFSTGTIEENGTTIRDGIYRRYQNSGLFTSEELDTMFKEVVVDGRTVHIFADYKNVEMDFFYLERGAGASNCHIKFNMPPIPDETIIVGKQITDANASVYSDVEFSFMLETKASEENEYTTVKNKTVKVYDASGNYVRDCPVDENGIFKLKHGERAYFTDIPATTQYRVTEVGVSSEEYEEVTITGVSVSQIGDGGSSQEIQGWRTEELTVAETPMVVFRNRIAAANKRELQITKRISSDDGDADYQIQVYLGDEVTAENGSPYTGEYWIAGQKYVATNGIITLEKDQTASITDIPSGTSFKVIEVGLDSNAYIEPVYSVQNADSINVEGSASGKLILNADSQVTVTNALKSTPDSTFIEVQKTFYGLNDPETKLPNFKIIVSSDEHQTDIVAELTLSDKNQKITNEDGSVTYIWKLDGLEGGTYWVKEENGKLENEFELTIVVNGKQVTVDITQQPIKVETVPPTFGFEKYQEIERCSSIALEFHANVVAARLTAQNDYFVWTEEPISSEEREAIVTAISGKDRQNWGDMSVANTQFYSGYAAESTGYAVGKGIIKVKSGEVTTLEFSSTNVWTHCISGIYQKTSGTNAEIEVVNTYTPEAVSIDIQKYGTKYTTEQLSGAKFTLYQQVTEGGTPTWSEVKNFDVTSGVELELQSGFYKLEETTAPNGYLKLSVPIYFKVDGKNVALVKADGNAYGTGDVLPDMWQLAEGETIELKIKNEVLYDLPSAGGPGIYMYMVGGVLLMSAGVLMIYRNKRREVLNRK